MLGCYSRSGHVETSWLSGLSLQKLELVASRLSSLHAERKAGQFLWFAGRPTNNRIKRFQKTAQTRPKTPQSFIIYLDILSIWQFHASSRQPCAFASLKHTKSEKESVAAKLNATVNSGFETKSSWQRALTRNCSKNKHWTTFLIDFWSIKNSWNCGEQLNHIHGGRIWTQPTPPPLTYPRTWKKGLPAIEAMAVSASPLWSKARSQGKLSPSNEWNLLLLDQSDVPVLTLFQPPGMFMISEMFPILVSSNRSPCFLKIPSCAWATTCPKLQDGEHDPISQRSSSKLQTEDSMQNKTRATTVCPLSATTSSERLLHSTSHAPGKQNFTGGIKHS